MGINRINRTPRPDLQCISLLQKMYKIDGQLDGPYSTETFIRCRYDPPPNQPPTGTKTEKQHTMTKKRKSTTAEGRLDADTADASDCVAAAAPGKKKEKTASVGAGSRRTKYGDDDMVKINVGGRIFMTLKSRLMTKSSFFRDMWAKHDDDNDDIAPTTTTIFLDQDPDAFAVILKYVRSGKIKAEDLTVDVLLLVEYLGFTELVRDIKIVSIQHKHAMGQAPESPYMLYSRWHRTHRLDPRTDYPENRSAMLERIKQVDFELYKKYQAYHVFEATDGGDDSDEEEGDRDCRRKAAVELFDELYGPSLEEAISAGFLPRNIRPELLEYTSLVVSQFDGYHFETVFNCVEEDDSDWQLPNKKLLGLYLGSSSLEESAERDVCKVLQREPEITLTMSKYDQCEYDMALKLNNILISDSGESIPWTKKRKSTASEGDRRTPSFFDAVQNLQLCGYTQLFERGISENPSLVACDQNEGFRIWFYRQRHRDLCRGSRKDHLDSFVASSIVFPPSTSPDTIICKEFTYMISLKRSAEKQVNGLFTTFGDKAAMAKSDCTDWDISSVTLAFVGKDMNDMVSWAKTRGYTTHEPLLEHYARYIKWRCEKSESPDASFDLDVCVLSRPLETPATSKVPR